MGVRLLVLAAVVVFVAGGFLVHRHRSRIDAARGAAGLPVFPAALLASEVTHWFVFTTPYCVSCNTAEDHLRRAHPDHVVRRIDAVADPDLARRYDIRRAPTVLEVDPTGQVLDRLVGLDAVRSRLAVADRS
jgi:hypothetical protein